LSWQNSRVLAWASFPQIMAEALLNLVDVHVRRGMNTVLDGCSLPVEGGQIMALTGANGAGKSTLLETAAGILPMEKGVVEHDGVVIADAEGRRRPSPLTVGMVLQRNGMLGSEILSEHLNAAMTMSGRSVDIEPFLKAFHLQHRANDLVAHLSQGQARKVAVLAGLLPAFASSTSSLVMLDEPDAGLDDASIATLCGWMTELRTMGHGLLVATHDERIVAHATHRFDVGQGTVNVASPPVEAEVEARNSKPVKPLSPRAFGVKIHLRTLMALNTNAMAGLITLGVLLALGDFMENLDSLQRMGFILAPTLAAGMCGDPLVAALREERAGVWWRAVRGRQPHGAWIPFAIGAVFTFLATTGFQEAREAHMLLVGGLLCFVLWHTVGWMQRSSDRLARPHAVFIGLLTPVLILPYSILISVLS
jgi:ABC-type multidrug transport system ATPase subunit